MNENTSRMDLAPSLPKKNEIIEILKDAFTKDLISIDEYEKRIGLAEGAKTIDEIELLTRDLPKYQSNDFISSEDIIESEILKCKMAKKNLNGTYLLSKKINIEASMSTIVMDYRGLNQIQGLHEINLKTEMTEIILFLPEHIQVENRINENMTTFKETKSNIENKNIVTTLIRFIGDASMTTIKIKRQKQRSWLFGKKLVYK